MSYRLAVIVAGIAALVGILDSARGQAQGPAARPAFEVMSVKLSSGCGQPGAPSGGRTTPGRVTLECAELRDLIRSAYGINANGRTQDPGAFLMQVEGGPGWVDSDHYSIDAKAEGDPPRIVLYGPMMQGLLEERFKLKVHRVTKEATVYLLTVAKGGPKFQATKTGSCVFADINHPLPAPVPGPPQPRTCGSQTVTPNGMFDMYGATMTQLSTQLAIRLGSNVTDKTDLSGMYDVHLELSRADMMPRMLAGGRPGGSGFPAEATDPTGPSIFTAVQQQLGLKLESGKSPAEFLVIDQIERPSEN